MAVKRWSFAANVWLCSLLVFGRTILSHGCRSIGLAFDLAGLERKRARFQLLGSSGGGGSLLFLEARPWFMCE